MYAGGARGGLQLERRDTIPFVFFLRTRTVYVWGVGGRVQFVVKNYLFGRKIYMIYGRLPG